MTDRSLGAPLARRIEASLRRLADPARAVGAKAYLKSDLDFIGVTTPEFRRAIKGELAAPPPLDRQALLATVEALWGPAVFELKAAAVELLEMNGALLEARDLALVERLLRGSRTWALVDNLAAHVVGGLVERFPSLGRTLDRWAKDDDFWVRRAAMLALLLPLRRGDGDFARFARYADAMLDEREFFIRKAIGWVLREVSKKWPALVVDWLLPRARRASGVTMREALRWLPPSDRERLLAARGEAPRRRRGGAVLVLVLLALAAGTGMADPAAPAPAIPSPSPSVQIAAGDAALGRLDLAAALTAYRAAVAGAPSSYEAAWRLARALTDEATLATDKEAQKKLCVEAEAYSRQAVNLEPNDAKGHDYLAIALGKLALFEGGRRKVDLSKEVKAEADRALALDPNDDLALHVLAIWNRELVELPWLLRQAAHVLYGRLPQGSLEDAIRDLEHASKLHPDVIPHHVELGITLEAAQRWSEAEAELEKALTLPTGWVTDDYYRGLARTHLAKVRAHLG